jgi:hypothetical protein
MATKTPYRIRAESVESCSCRHGCNCQFEGFPNEGMCEFIIGYDIQEGRVGEVSLDGVKAVVAAKYPGAIHEGNAHVVVYIDEKASPGQVDALVSVLTGQLGGMPWEALAGTISKLEGPIRKPIEIKPAGEHSKVSVPGAIEVQFTPLRDVVSGEEKEVQVVYPKGGFFWNSGRVCTTRTMHAQHGGFALSWPGKYACAAEVNWTNQ